MMSMTFDCPFCGKKLVIEADEGRIVDDELVVNLRLSDEATEHLSSHGPLPPGAEVAA